MRTQGPRRPTLLAAVAACLAVALAVAGLAVAATSSDDEEEIPPVPACFKVANVDCFGIPVRSDGVPLVKVTEADSENLDSNGAQFTVKGQLTADLTTVQRQNEQGQKFYNHYDWSHPNATAVRGCAQNDAECTVRIARGGEWTPVLLSLDDYPVKIFLLHGAAPPVQITGRVIRSVHDGFVEGDGDHNVDLVRNGRLRARDRTNRAGRYELDTYAEDAVLSGPRGSCLVGRLPCTEDVLLHLKGLKKHAVVHVDFYIPGRGRKPPTPADLGEKSR